MATYSRNDPGRIVLRQLSREQYRASQSIHACVVIGAIVALLLIAPLPSAHGQGTSCPLDDGWTRLAGAPRAQLESDNDLPWILAQPNLNIEFASRLRAIAAGWEAPGTIYAGGSVALYRSRDCGIAWDVAWTPYSPPDADRGMAYIGLLVAAPNGRLYAGTSTDVMSSGNFGNNWGYNYRLGTPLGLAASTSDPDTAYVFGWHNGAPSGSHSADRVILRTTDRGIHWERRTRGMPPGSGVVDPANASVVYVIGRGIVHRSVDGANTFETYAAYDADAHETGLASVSADGSRMWWLSGSRFFVSHDRGRAWKWLPGSPFVGYVKSLSASPHDPRVVFALVKDEIWAYREPVEKLVDDPGQPSR
jgi:hypothetical protein